MRYQTLLWPSALVLLAASIPEAPAQVPEWEAARDATPALQLIIGGGATAGAVFVGCVSGPVGWIAITLVAGSGAYGGMAAYQNLVPVAKCDPSKQIPEKRALELMANCHRSGACVLSPWPSPLPAHRPMKYGLAKTGPITSWDFYQRYLDEQRQSILNRSRVQNPTAFRASTDRSLSGAERYRSDHIAPAESTAAIFDGQVNQMIRSSRPKNREILEYVSWLPEEFSADLVSLGPNDAWLDAGCGDAQALQDYLEGKRFSELDRAYNFVGVRDEAMAAVRTRRLEQKASVIGVTMAYEDRPKWTGHPKFNLVGLGKRFEQVDLKTVGRNVEIITDLYGATFYGKEIDVTLQKYLQLLEVGRRAYILLERPTKMSTWIRLPNGESISFEEFLHTIRGARVWRVGTDAHPTPVIILEKTSEEFHVPRLNIDEESSHWDRFPPLRHYRWADAEPPPLPKIRPTSAAAKQK